MSRFQGFLVAVLLLASVAMGVLLWQMRQRAHQRLLDGEDSAPTQAPAVAAAQEITLQTANDADGSIQTQSFTLPLPVDPGTRARAILGKLLDLYAAPGSTHPVPGGAASIAQVFLLPAQPLYAAAPKPGDDRLANANRPASSGSAASTPVASGTSSDAPAQSGSDSAADPATPQLAVVNLTSAFANGHPSGFAAETLTILSINATLHANLPRVTQVRYLVDGQSRSTLAGHADLTRIYLTSDAAATAGAQP